MSPEQARGLPVDARTDIFSLGVVLYEMLTGNQPFAGETTSDAMAAILKSEPAPLGENTPAELQRIVGKTLQKNADERYQTVKDLLVDLKNLKRELEFTEEIERSNIPSFTKSANVGATHSSENSTAIQPAPISTQNSFPYRPSSAGYIIGAVKKRKFVSLGALAALVVALAATGYVRFFAMRSEAINSIAVLPFQNESGDANLDYLSDGLSESLINGLSQLPKLSVKVRSSVFRYKGKEVEAQQLASELSVQAILNGRVVQRGDDLTLYLSLVDARNGNQLWGEQYNRKLTDLVSLQSEITRDVSEKLRLRLTSTEQQRLTKQGTENTEAYQAYLKGRYYWNRGLAPGYEKSRDYYQQAIDLDPSYAQAYFGLAAYYSFLSANGLLPPDETWPKAEAAANKALALDPTLADSYSSLAAVKLYCYRDWPAAERYFRRGIELNPNFAETHMHYAINLNRFGRNEEALARGQRAVELEPLSLRLNQNLARLLFFMRQYDRAIDQFRKTLELDPNFAPAHEWLGYAYEQKGMEREAIIEWGKALSSSGAGEEASSLERTYATSGFEPAVRALAQQRLEQLDERMKRGEYIPASEYVRAYTRLGDKEQALARLDKAVQERNQFALEVKVNPIYDKLRDDPRFQDLLRRVGLPQ